MRIPGSVKILLLSPQSWNLPRIRYRGSVIWGGGAPMHPRRLDHVIENGAERRVSQPRIVLAFDESSSLAPHAVDLVWPVIKPANFRR